MATEAEKAIEAILMVAQEPVDPHLLAQVLEVSPDRVEELCTALAAGYQEQDRGFVLLKVAGGYRFQSHGDLAPYVERFVLEGQSARLSAAALETLAIVAYKQPMSRAQVASIRGVNVDGVMRTLQQRGYIVEVGRDPGPGQATLFGTSNEFLERLGLASIHDLPPIADLFPSAEIMEALEHGLRADRPAPLPLDDDPTQPPLEGPDGTDPSLAAGATDAMWGAPSEATDDLGVGPASVDHWSDDDEVEEIPEPDFMADDPWAPEADEPPPPGDDTGIDTDTDDDGADPDDGAPAGS